MTERDMERVYRQVNEAWPDGPHRGYRYWREPQFDAREATIAVKRLWKHATGKPLAIRGLVKLTSGNRRNRFRRGIFNPQRGWHGLVHSVSHAAHRRLHPDDPDHIGRHAYLERRLIEYAVARKWHEGARKRPEKPMPTKADQRTRRQAALRARLAKWEAKQRRAETAIRKLKGRIRRHERGGG